jgi:hypothetical protein
MAAARLASFVAPGGLLLVICRAREAHEDPGSLPWPLTKADLELFCDAGLSVDEFEDFFDHEEPPVRRFRVTHRRAPVFRFARPR